MVCSICKGIVEWQGPLSNLSHTKCLQCGEINTQIIGEGEIYVEEKESYE